METSENVETKTDDEMSEGNYEVDVDNPVGGVSGTKKVKLRSIVWTQSHFYQMKRNGIKYGVCNYCRKEYKLSGGANSTTGNMLKHLQRKHVDKLDQADKDGQEDKAFIFSQDNFRKALLKWLVVCDEPFKAVQTEAFAEVVKTLNPDAVLYSDKTMRADLIDTFNEKLNELKVRLSQIPGKLAVTMDGWTSKNMLSFLAIRAHWLDEQWNYQSQLLDFCHIDGSHSEETFKDLFWKSLQLLEVPLDKIISITVDNASSNDTFFDQLEDIFDILADDQHIRCLAHIINLAAQDMLKSLNYFTSDPDEEPPQAEGECEDELNNEVLEDIDLDAEIIDCDESELSQEDNENTIIKLRTLVRKIRKSVQLRQKLKKMCSIYVLKYLTPILDVMTRWNSTYDMILRAEYLKVPLKMLFSGEKSLASLRITDRQWLELSEVKKVLQKFYRATQLISMERHSTIDAYLPTLDWLIENYENDDSVPDGKQNNEDEDEELFSHMFKRLKQDPVHSEIQKFLSLPLPDRKTKPIDYWSSRNIQDEFPKLSKMARDILPIQSASVAVERDF
ncbi:putative AC transposase, partial [Pseudolycoriella hygida]